VGYQFFKQFWGNGYAPEAAKIFIDFAQAHQLSQDIISLIDVNNIKSQRVAEKNGLFRSERIIWTGLDIYVYRKVL
jgi:RimJ/RimL family protein N-acetyltransferase